MDWGFRAVLQRVYCSVSHSNTLHDNIQDLGLERRALNNITETWEV